MRVFNKFNDATSRQVMSSAYVIMLYHSIHVFITRVPLLAEPIVFARTHDLKARVK